MNASIPRTTPSQVVVLSQRERGILRLMPTPEDREREMTYPALKKIRNKSDS